MNDQAAIEYSPENPWDIYHYSALNIKNSLTDATIYTGFKPAGFSLVTINWRYDGIAPCWETINFCDVSCINLR
ncbi:hypothetical protein GCM10009096_25810 [Parasphingorhabdus litoris]|uniref:Uncharacterized protein n=1 Tax=Parasphingorhabdus litoris TaxID=394733 RepID=A0ABN1ARH5_9SPHN